MIELNIFHAPMQSDGSQLVTGSYDGQARIWASDGKLFLHI